MDLSTGILSNEISLFDDKGPVPTEKIQDFLQQGKEKLVSECVEQVMNIGSEIHD
jgi:hypothetical protein